MSIISTVDINMLLLRMLKIVFTKSQKRVRQTIFRSEGEAEVSFAGGCVAVYC